MSRSIAIGVSFGILLTGCGGIRHSATVPPAVRPSQNFISTIAQIKQSVIPIVCVQLPTLIGADPTLTSVEGSAFFLNADGTFATAGHVVRDLTAPQRRVPCQQAAIYVPVGGWTVSSATFRVQYFYFSEANCARDESLDIAVCKTPWDIASIMGSSPHPVELETTLQPDGTPAAFTGFPLQQVVPLTSQGFTAAYRNTPDEAGPREFVIDKPSWPGASGSPIYLENGKVIGILLERGIGEGVGITVGRPVSFIKQVMSKRQ